MLRNNSKVIISPILKKIGTYINNASYGNTGNLDVNKKGKKSSGKINLNNLKKNNEKLKFNDVQFPKAKLSNYYYYLFCNLYIEINFIFYFLKVK